MWIVGRIAKILGVMCFNINTPGVRLDEPGVTMSAAKYHKIKTLGLVALVSMTSQMAPAPASADTGGVVAAPVVRVDGGWAVMADSSLKATLEGWSKAAGWTLIWDNAFDYRLRASASFGGGYEEAVGRLIDSIYQSNPEITVTLYRGNRVLHVQEQSLTSN
jgi:hypothetical protein